MKVVMIATSYPWHLFTIVRIEDASSMHSQRHIPVIYSLTYYLPYVLIASLNHAVLP